jgi:hypothetical protein
MKLIPVPRFAMYDHKQYNEEIIPNLNVTNTVTD